MVMKESGIEWVGLIPNDWKIAKNNRLFNISKQLVNENWKNTQLLSLTKSGIIEKNINDGGGKQPESFGTYQYVEKDDIVLCLFDIDVSAVFSDRSKYDGMISPAYRVMKCTNAILPVYAKWWFDAVNIGRYYLIYTKSLRKTIDADGFGNILTVVPPLSEQKAIADYLDETCSKIDEIIAEAKASIDEYKELKQSVITEAVLHGFEEKSVKHSSIEWIGDYNAEFGMTRIGRFCSVTKLAGFEYTNAMTDSIVNEFGVPIVRAQNVKMFKFYSDKIREFIPKDISFQLNRSSLNKKCLLITFIGAGIGDVCVFDEKERYHLAPNVAKIEIFDEYKCLLDEHYLMYYLGSEAGQGEIRRISKASAQPSLSMETIRSINVVLPPFDVQEQIVEYLNKKMLHMDSLIAEKQSLIADLEAYKKSLIYEVVTGKRRVV